MGQVVACFIWTPSPHHKLSTWDLLVAGMWLVPYRFGIPTLIRLMQVVEDFDVAHKRFFDDNNNESSNNGPDTDFMLLERMAVRSDCRGTGLGTQALQAVIPHTERPMRLTTQEERNVRFYKRLGYTVVGEVDFCENNPEYNYHSWFMLLQNTKG
jgi:GNAT superfamily N-acetyltransferase